jgi:hypothetical protein
MKQADDGNAKISFGFEWRRIQFERRLGGCSVAFRPVSGEFVCGLAIIAHFLLLL